MNIDVLEKRSSLSSTKVTANYLDGELRVVPDWSCASNGTIISLLLGVDIQHGKSKYPEVQTWRKRGDEFTRVESRTIVLIPGNFSASGVFQYHLTTPLPVVAGDMIGVYQPNNGESAVRLFYDLDRNAPDAYYLNTKNRAESPSTFSVTRGRVSVLSERYILLSVVTGKES